MDTVGLRCGRIVKSQKEELMLEFAANIGYLLTFFLWPQVAALGVVAIVLAKSNASSLAVKLFISLLGLLRGVYVRYRGF